jgi:hypothetical protein
VRKFKSLYKAKLHPYKYSEETSPLKKVRGWLSAKPFYGMAMHLLNFSELSL